MPQPHQPDPPQPSFPNLIIRASAGTGKTFALSNRYLSLLAAGVEVQEILASTFTKKGAGEILDRIISRLSNAALNKTAAEKLSSEIGTPLSQTEAGQVLLQLLQSLHRLEIGTLDSLFSRIARVFSLELGLPPGWEIVENQQIKHLQDKAITEVLQTESVLELLQLLSKGEVTRRVASLLRDTVDNVYDIFRQSGLEPWDQIPSTTCYLSEPQIDQLVIQLKNLPLHLSSLQKHREKLLDLIAKKDWMELSDQTSLQNVLDGKDTFGKTPMPDELIEVVQRLIQQCRAFQEDLLIRQNQATRDLLHKFHKILHRLKSFSGDLRFDDVTERLQEFIQQCDARQCAYRLDSQYRHLLLDEFQDTSLTQWNVLRPFAERVTAVASDQQSFFCVGDMKQAIFGWRGGIAEIFDQVAAELPNLQTEGLARSYRSSQPVIDFVNQIFIQAPEYHCDDPIAEQAIAQWHQWFPLHQTARQDLAGYVLIEKSPSDEFLDPSARELSGTARLDWNTLQRIQKLRQQLFSHQTIGVIVRTNAEVSRIMSLLKQHGIPASDESGSSLVDSAAVELILSAMKLADQPGDSVARFHLSHSPLGDVLGLPRETQTNQSELAAAGAITAEKLRSRLLLEGYGAVVESLAEALTPFCTSKERNRLRQLVQLSYSAAYHCDPWDLRPGRFVNYVINDVRVSEPNSSQVRVMTIHKAKGLEFDAVVYPIPPSTSGWRGQTPAVVVYRPTPTAPISLATRYVKEKNRKFFDQSLQQVFVQENQREVREALCVLYVALTRAAHAIYVIVADNANPENKSTAGLILSGVGAAAEEDPVTGRIYHAGDPDWYRQHPPASPAKNAAKIDLNGFYQAEFQGTGNQELISGVRSGRGMSATSQAGLAHSSHDLQSLVQPDSRKSPSGSGNFGANPQPGEHR
jgi:ATP-dependent helicase/nuclease subunit A